MHVVKYSGPFGFIKPWTAVRDGETFSQQFLTPSIIKGIELKLFPELLNWEIPDNNIQKIIRHRLSYNTVSSQQEQIHPKAFTIKRNTASRSKSILKRGVLINPILHLAFSNISDAKRASEQHICLCRNEDVLLPHEDVLELTENEFDMIEGFELIFVTGNDSFMVGFNRFNNAEPMYGKIEIHGNPTRTEIIE
ncbi:MAG: hypothetical protein FD143_2731 [Ignavibacteria bacterium]|nr:MAG: hypothetical protein FD143_2731 [Ignavibacteria bacterium]KAF0157627.1 MAG: hypothetical protein FD188_2726 [Ignavibacteria bacterium]